MSLKIHSGPFEGDEFIVNCYGTSVEETFMYLGRDSSYERGPMELSCAPEKAVTFDFHHAYRDRLKESPVFPANSMGISKAISYLQKLMPEEFIKTAVDRVAGRYLQGNRA